MKDATLLLCASGALATFAWAFWHYLGTDGLSAMSIIAILIVGVDNARLRAKLRARREDRSAP